MIESEKRTPSFKMIEKIADALKIEAPQLFALENYPLESSSQIKENLMCQFDKFLRAATKEIKK